MNQRQQGGKYILKVLRLSVFALQSLGELIIFLFPVFQERHCY